MAVLLILVAAVLAWAVWKGKLSPAQLPPVALGIAGAFLAARGNFLIGVAALGIAITWYRGLTWRLFGTRAKQSEQYAIDKARFMLGVSRFDNAEYIRERHQTLMAKNLPETGGSEERTTELNKARDLLLHDVAQRDKKA